MRRHRRSSGARGQMTDCKGCTVFHEAHEEIQEKSSLETLPLHAKEWIQLFQFGRCPCYEVDGVTIVVAKGAPRDIYGLMDRLK